MILQPIVYGTLLKRYKRFLADVVLDKTGEVVTAHCPNPGAMIGLLDKGNPVILSISSNPKRKLPYTLQAIYTDKTWVGVNTALPNELMAESLTAGTLLEFNPYLTVRREVPYGQNCRIDFLLHSEETSDCYLEVKNVHLKRQDKAEFPDCITTRGSKQIKELAALAQKGFRCVVTYIIQREDCSGFKIADDLDPHYAKACEFAKGCGVETLILNCRLSATDSCFNVTLNPESYALGSS